MSREGVASLLAEATRRWRDELAEEERDRAQREGPHRLDCPVWHDETLADLGMCDCPDGAP